MKLSQTQITDRESTILLWLKSSISSLATTNSTRKSYEASETRSTHAPLLSSISLWVKNLAFQTRSLSIVGGILVLLFLSLIFIAVDRVYCSIISIGFKAK